MLLIFKILFTLLGDTQQYLQAFIQSVLGLLSQLHQVRESARRGVIRIAEFCPLAVTDLILDVEFLPLVRINAEFYLGTYIHSWNIQQ